MEIIKTVTKPVDEVTDVICDICGGSCKVDISLDGSASNLEYLNLETYWGYGSGKDLQRWTAQVCEPCVDKHLKPLIKFKIDEYM